MCSGDSNRKFIAAKSRNHDVANKSRPISECRYRERAATENNRFLRINALGEAKDRSNQPEQNEHFSHRVALGALQLLQQKM